MVNAARSMSGNVALQSNAALLMQDIYRANSIFTHGVALRHRSDLNVVNQGIDSPQSTVYDCPGFHKAIVGLSI